MVQTKLFYQRIQAYNNSMSCKQIFQSKNQKQTDTPQVVVFTLEIICIMDNNTINHILNKYKSIPSWGIDINYQYHHKSHNKFYI